MACQRCIRREALRENLLDRIRRHQRTTDYLLSLTVSAVDTDTLERLAAEMEGLAGVSRPQAVRSSGSKDLTC